MTETQLRDDIAAQGRSIFERGLTHGATGHISAALADGYRMTPTGSNLGGLDPARLSKLDGAGRHIGGDPPTKEAFLHLAMYRARPNAKAVVHLHGTHSVAVSCLPEVDPADVLPPLTAYYVLKIGRLPLIPYYRPGDRKLGDAIRGLAAKNRAVLLANHGPVVAGKSPEDAVYATEELEETAKPYLLLHGRNPRCLTEAQIAELRETFSLP